MLEDKKLSTLATVITPLPPVPTHDVFTAEQWTTLLSICEVLLPDLTSKGCTDTAIAQLRDVLPENSDDKLINTFLSESVIDNAAFKESLRQRFVGYVPEAQVKGVAFLLSALDSMIGSLAMTGSTIPLRKRGFTDRSRIVYNWANSSISPLRALYQAGEFLTKATWVAQSQTLHRLLDYPKVPKNIERHPGYDFKFLDFGDTPAEGIVKIDADVVIVGSGCGAGVVAEHLSASLTSEQSKPRILVLEKSYHFPSSHFPMDQSAAGVNIQEGGGGVLADDGSIAVLAGSTWGGGGTINWSASLQPQRFVREEWATKNKLPFVLSKDFQGCLDEVCTKMGVCRATDFEGLARIEQNFGNSTLLESSRLLGLKAEVVPQNTAGKRHYCGRCGMGCASATKQGPANFWLPAAAEKGVEFVEGCFVEEIIWTAAAKRTAKGLNATWTSRSRDVTRKLQIIAKHIVVSSGTLHSPVLLHRSGLTPEVNKNIGSNLHLHPTMTARGTYHERVNPWDGAILTSVMTSLENYDGKGHGPKVEIMLGIPELTSVVMPYRTKLSLEALAEAKTKGLSADEAAAKTALDYRVRIAKHGYSFSYIAIQRDHANDNNLKRSYVYNDPDDNRKVKFSYTPSAKDRECILQGAMIAARMHYVMGAKTIDICSPHIELFERPSAHEEDSSHSLAADDAAFEAWLSNIKAKGLSLLDTRTTRLGSAHQMSTCRMSASPEDGVVDSSGKVWATDNVYVADASILPSASGVNPMVTTMAFSLHIARGLAEKIKNSA